MLPDLSGLKARRKALGISQQQLASDVGISQSLLAKVEKGSVVPNYNIAKKLLERLEVLEHSNEKTAGSVMHRKVVALKAADTIRRMTSIAKREGISQFPVYDGKSIIGSITTKDVMGIEGRISVGSVAKAPFPTISEDVPVSTVKELLKSSSAVLVVRGSKVVGIITPEDMI
ncbi:MAG: CBS domain-containing protein [Candidatus Micrarchaeia archaeon]